MRKKLINLIVILITVFTIVTFFIGVVNYNYFQDKLNQGLESYGVIAVLYIVLFLELIPQYLTGHISVVTAIIIGLNPISIAFATLCGSIIASLLGFELGRVYGKEFVNNVVNSKTVERIKGGINQKGRLLVLLAAITPIPYIPLVIGMTGMKRSNFILWGLIPRELGYILTIIATYLIS
jgi:uncharacterized membrane protein YdjX (TVP38/TMEM64 family)